MVVNIGIYNPIRLMAMLFEEREGTIEGKETKRRVDSKLT